MAQRTKYGISQIQLTQMMDVSDKRGIKRVEEHGGIEDIAANLKTNLKDGLSPEETASEERRREFGMNYVEPRPPKSFLALVFEAAQDKVLLVLLVCAIISIILSVSIVTPEERKTGWVEGFAILAAVFIVVMVTAINDYTKERQFRELQKKLDSTSRYTVIREGERLEVGTDEILVGDVVDFKYGDAFPCDGLFIRGNDVTVSEASLTGESNNIKKNSKVNPFMYSGTQVMEGAGTMLAVAVGPHSQHGIILALLTTTEEDDDGFITAALKSLWKKIRPPPPERRKSIPSSSPGSSESDQEDEKGIEIKVSEESADEEDKEEEYQMSCCQKMLHPRKWMKNKKEIKKIRNSKKKESSGSVLQRKLTRLALQIGYFGIAAAVLIVIVGIVRHCIEEYGIEGRSWQSSDAILFLRFFINGLTVLVVAVPEGLPLAVTIALAYSIKKMLRDNNLVRHLLSCETMGNATCICSDKTGTLTTNRMTVVDSFIAQKRYTGMVPVPTELPEVVADTLAQTIAVNSSYSSTLKRPGCGLDIEGTGLLRKVAGMFRRKHTPVQSSDNGEAGKVKGCDEPLSVEELKALVRGEGGKLVQQIGNPTECALLGLLTELDVDFEGVRLQHPKEDYVKQFTFNSARKSMTTVIPLPNNKGSRVLTKGASEIVLSKCANILTATGEIVELTDEIRADIKSSVVANMASKALRTIGVAYKDVTDASGSLEGAEEIAVLDSGTDWDNEDQVVAELTLVGIVGIEDPVRPEVFQSIKKCQRAGITVRMVTGDNIDTARSIAEKCGIIPKGDKSSNVVMEGPKFRQKVMDADGEPSQEKLDKVWPRLRVLARSSPKDKYTLVDGIINSRLTKTREVVAVTGDGTNDGPALKRADVGFAMGIAGTDVAKEACDIILTDDNFASIVKAVKWGRNIYDAISKFLQFQLTVNVVAVTTAVIGAFTIGDTPLRAIQLLWVNLVMDTFASLALATEPPTDELLKRAPYGRKKKLISRRMFLFIIGHSIYQLTTLLILLFLGPQLFDIDEGDLEDLFAPPSQHFTIIFNSFVFMQIFNEFNARRIHGEQNVFNGMHRNLIFLGIMIIQVIFQILWVELPWINREVFKATNLTPDLWLWCVFLGSIELIIGQILSIIPIEKIPEFKWPWEHGEEDHIDWEEDDDNKAAKVLWVKSLNRLRTQIRVVNAFKAGLDSGDNIHLSRLPHLTTTPKSKRYYGEDQLNCQVSDV